MEINPGTYGGKTVFFKCFKMPECFIISTTIAHGGSDYIVKYLVRLPLAKKKNL